MSAERDTAAAGVLRYAALRDGVLAGGAGLRIADGVAQFAGAATAPAHRRHGIQAALLSARARRRHGRGLRRRRHRRPARIEASLPPSPSFGPATCERSWRQAVCYSITGLPFT